MHPWSQPCQEACYKFLRFGGEGAFAGFGASETRKIEHAVPVSMTPLFPRGPGTPTISRYGVPPALFRNAEKSNPASDHVISASRDRGKPVVSDESVPWFQGIMVMNQPQPPRLLETMRDRRHQKLGTHEKLTFKPNGTKVDRDQEAKEHGKLDYHGS
jgi:hypothetical protein